MDDLEEVVATLADVTLLLDELVVSGLRSAGRGTLGQLRARRDEFARIGAAHLARQHEQLVAELERDDPEAATTMVRLQTSLRLFERFVSQQAAALLLQALVATPDAAEESP